VVGATGAAALDGRPSDVVIWREIVWHVIRMAEPLAALKRMVSRRGVALAFVWLC
jgi:hypothetical protein